jgi:hypothetical protein
MRSRARPSPLPGPLLLLAALAACGGEAAPAPPAGPKVVTFDFGRIPHGRIVEQELVLGEPGEHAGRYLRGFTAGCPLCASGVLILESADGRRVQLDGPPGPEATIRPDQRLLVRLRIDTTVKEAQDLPPQKTRGQALLGEPTPGGRTIELPVEFTFAIDAPVEIAPFPHVALGSLMRGSRSRHTLELRGDAEHPSVRFGPVRSSDPRLSAMLRDDEGRTLLDVEYTLPPDAFDGPLRPMQIEIGTDLRDDYVVRLPVSGTVLPRFQIEPPYGIRLDSIAPGRESNGFANVIDNDLDASPELAVLRVADRQGQPLDEHFEVRLEPLTGLHRTTRVHLRYRGTLDESFFGTIELCRPGKPAPLVSVEFRGLRR